eukprot:6791265-Pyramimonas_sp.AAC.1
MKCTYGELHAVSNFFPAILWCWVFVLKTRSPRPSSLLPSSPSSPSSLRFTHPVQRFVAP